MSTLSRVAIVGIAGIVVMKGPTAVNATLIAFNRATTTTTTGPPKTTEKGRGHARSHITPRFGVVSNPARALRPVLAPELRPRRETAYSPDLFPSL